MNESDRDKESISSAPSLQPHREERTDTRYTGAKTAGDFVVADEFYPDWVCIN